MESEWLMIALFEIPIFRGGSIDFYRLLLQLNLIVETHSIRFEQFVLALWYRHLSNQNWT